MCDRGICGNGSLVRGSGSSATPFGGSIPGILKTEYQSIEYPT
jgi:hypothetical protein